MKVELAIVPPGGGEIDYSIFVELPELPRVGDWIMVPRPADGGAEDFIVRRVVWLINDAGDKGTSTLNKVYVECEFALGPMSTEAHKKCCKSYSDAGAKVAKF